MNQKKLMTVKEYAERYNLTTAAVYARRSAGKLSTEKRGGQIYIVVGEEKPSHQDSQEVDHGSELIDVLKRENEHLKEIIKNRDEELKEQRSLVATALENQRQSNALVDQFQKLMALPAAQSVVERPRKSVIQPQDEPEVQAPEEAVVETAVTPETQKVKSRSQKKQPTEKALKKALKIAQKLAKKKGFKPEELFKGGKKQKKAAVIADIEKAVEPLGIDMAILKPVLKKGKKKGLWASIFG